ncbi:2987_t:CDS:2 [Dentiscutata heterogama]|uniref:2987_t:CDS:1 n=1 Tax=Dentiscutata heterogama TaxID=1316150 RepID=A0ACA9MR02_9GLOM|nr:2987_t:CDS:2 [Dentiscutata heterogama]
MATRNKRIIDVELDEIMLKKTCQTIVHSADLETITIKQVRRDAEVKLGLTAKFLDKQPWKDLIHEFVTEAIQKSKSEDVSVAYSSRPKSRRAEDSKDDSIVEDGGSVMALENKVARESDQGLNKSRTKEFRNDKHANSSMEEDSENDINSESKRSNDAEISDTEHEIVKKKRKEKSTTTKRVSFNSGDSHNELEDDPPKKRKTKKGKSAPTVSSNNDDDEATIKELKAFIVKCGVRKVWSRELADCDSISSQIDRLNKILSDLGIKGRPTLEKCKKIRKRRELEAELNSMDVGNIVSDDIKEGRKARASRGIFNPTGRRIIRAKRQIEDETDDGASDQDSE